MTALASVGRVFKDTGHQCWGQTGVCGLSHAYNSERKPLRLVWLALFASGMVLTILDVINVIDDYRSYPHTTKMEVVYDRSALFPAVTVCSQSRIDCLRLLNASMNAPEDEQLGKVLRSADCLGKGALECPYIWTLAARVDWKEWDAYHNASCLQCAHCSNMNDAIQSLKGKPGGGKVAKPYEKVFAEIGCNTTCPQPPPQKESPDSTPKSTDAAHIDPKETAGSGTKGAEGTEGSGTKGQRDSADYGIGASKGTDGVSTSDSTDTADSYTGDDKRINSRGYSESKGTSDGGTKDSGDTSNSGTTGEEVMADRGTAKSRVGRRTDAKSAQMMGGPGGPNGWVSRENCQLLCF